MKSQKKILFSGIAYDEGKSGISSYINEVVPILCEDHEVHMLMLERETKNFKYEHQNLKIIKVSNTFAKPILNMLWHLFLLPHAVNFKNYDLCYLPAVNRRLMHTYPIPTVGIFHDLSQFHIKGKYGLLRTFYIKKVIPFFLKKCAAIVAISENTKKDMIRYYELAAEKISVIHNGFNTSKYSSPKDIETDSQKYIYYVSRLEHPGKNHIKLIEAYELLPKELQQKYKLIFTGQAWSGSEEIYQKIASSRLKESIEITGFVSSHKLLEMYKNASLFAFPSFYEGFGFPVLEAMASKTPVICSNTSSLPEIGGEAVLTFDPQSAEEISLCIQNVLSSEELQKQLIKKGNEQVKKFCWKTHVQSVLSLITK